MDILPDHPDKFDLDWLAQKINQPAGSLQGFEIKPIGTGQMGDSYRITLNWRTKLEGQPKTIVAKCPAKNEISRQTGAHLRNYAIEVEWYKNFANLAKTRTPHCYFTDINDGLDNFVLLMEDLAPAKQGDQIAGASLQQVKLALSEAAHLHGFKWNDSSLNDIEWLNYNKGNTDFIKNLVPKIYPEWCERYKNIIDDDVLEMGKDFVAKLEKYLDSGYAKPLTITHTDLRLDNILFNDETGRAVILDWQTASIGMPMSDVAYCICTSFASSNERAKFERSLVEEYLSKLSVYNGGEYGLEEAWQQYRRSAFSGFLVGVIAAMLVERTERGDAMFAAMAGRSGAAAIHLESLSLI